MDDTLVDAAHIWAVFGAAALSGYISCFSYAGVATISEAPLDVTVKQFSKMYNIGKTSSPPLAITAALCNGFSAYQARDRSGATSSLASPSTFYIAAAVTVMAIVPFTLLYMEPAVNSKLLSLGSQASKGVKAEYLGTSEEELSDLLSRWKGLNFVRGGLAALSALLSAVATMT